MIGVVSSQDLCSNPNQSVMTCSGCLWSSRIAACHRLRFGLRKGLQLMTVNFACEHLAGRWMTPACESQLAISLKHLATFILYTLFSK